MKIKRINISKSTFILLTIVAWALSNPTFAECINTKPPTQVADVVMSIDAKNACDNINGQEGIYIKGGITSPDGVPFSWTRDDGTTVGFNVISEYNDSGAIKWKLESICADDQTDCEFVGADTVIFGGASGGDNNCGMVYYSDAFSGYGGYCTQWSGDQCVNFQNYTGLSVCSNLKTDNPMERTPDAIPLQPCQTSEQAALGELGKLDDTGIECPLNDDGSQKEVVVCNFEKDEYAWGTIGANEDGSAEQVCCTCGIPEEVQDSCFLSGNETLDEVNGCATVLTSDPRQEVDVSLERIDGDPCTKIVSGGKVYKTCW
jgi:hypothetical protein